jgi:hypothetical protein
MLLDTDGVEVLAVELTLPTDAPSLSGMFVSATA